MSRLPLVLGVILTLALGATPAARASHNADVHSPNFSLVANFDDGGEAEDGSDLAFWGNLAVVPT